MAVAAEHQAGFFSTKAPLHHSFRDGRPKSIYHLRPIFQTLAHTVGRYHPLVRTHRQLQRVDRSEMAALRCRPAQSLTNPIS